MNRSRAGGLAFLVGILGVAGLALLAPTRARAGLATLQELASAGLGRVPVPVLVALVLLLAVVLWFVAVRYLLGLAYRLWRRCSARVYWAMTLVLPESPLVRFAAGSMVLIAAIVVIVGGLPVLLDLTESEEGAAAYADRMGSQAMNAEFGDIVDGDTVGGEPACDGDGGSAAVDGTDRDQDGIPDAWERAGETPDGAALPGADPGRKDLYVQVNHGSGTEPLTAAERRQLRATWARMPVSNPDGSRGVSLHLSEVGGGDLGEAATISRLEARNTYYTESRLGPRQCVYRQVVYGTLAVEDVAGVASSPGYAAFVEGTRQPDYPGNVSLRVAVTNHELLHTAVGTVDGRSHTSDGWLASPPASESLSRPTARDMNETGIYGPAT